MNVILRVNLKLMKIDYWKLMICYWWCMVAVDDDDDDNDDSFIRRNMFVHVITLFCFVCCSARKEAQQRKHEWSSQWFLWCLVCYCHLDLLLVLLLTGWVMIFQPLFEPSKGYQMVAAVWGVNSEYPCGQRVELSDTFWKVFVLSFDQSHLPLQQTNQTFQFHVWWNLWRRILLPTPWQEALWTFPGENQTTNTSILISYKVFPNHHSLVYDL